jgi:class 3 adenylate cyclase/predicted ATPase
MNVAAWLRSLGLERYEPAFREHEIDAEILPSLTTDDLRELGVSLVGHRRKLLDAITALRSGTSLPEPGAPRGEEALHEPAFAEAERRHVTVLFCDLVGSTALSERIDPEDMRELIRVYHGCVAGCIQSFQGYVAKYMGDGVLAYFGYPEAHEDDAERAVRAATGILASVTHARTPEPLQVRIGMATGLVVVGEFGGDGGAHEQGIVGDPPNLAARLQAVAEPGAVVVADSTRRLLGGLFEVEDLGEIQLKGFGRAQRAWRVAGEGRTLSRFEALRSGEAPLLGRDEELSLLWRSWQRAATGEGHLILLSAEPGVGKSRLTATLQDRVRPQNAVRLNYFCSPYHQDSALHPFVGQLERAAGFVPGETGEARRAKVEALLGPQADSVQDIGIISELLQVPAPDGVVTLELSPKARKELTFDAMLNQLRRLSAERPVLMVFEDLQWADPTSREFLDLLVEAIERLPVLLVATHRPEFVPPWSGLRHLTSVALGRLGRADAERLVRSLKGNGAALSEETVAEIVERSDGVPLFLEELTKSVLESAGLNPIRNGRMLSAVPQGRLSVPATLHASLLARLDHVGTSAREVAQVGSAIGREFSYDLLNRVLMRDDASLQSSLQRLVAASLLFKRGVGPEASYWFKHGLIQDVAYGTLLRGPRRDLHLRIAEALEQDFGAVRGAQPELIARHFAEAGCPERALPFWLEAGRRAAQRFANAEAITHFARGTEALAEMPETEDRLRQELAFQLALGPVLMASLGPGAPEVEQAYRRADMLARQVGDVDQTFATTWGLWHLHEQQGKFRNAQGYADALLAITASEADTGLRLQAHHASWTTSFYLPAFDTCRRHVTEGRRLFDRQKHRTHRFLYGDHDPGVCCLCHTAVLEWIQGRADKALASAREALSLARDLAHPNTLMIALAFNSFVHQFRCEPKETAANADELEALCASAGGNPRWAATAQIMRGWSRAADQPSEEAVDAIRDGITSLKQAGVQLRLPYFLSLLAETQLAAANVALGISTIDEGLAQVAATGERWWEGELLRLKGESLVLAGRRVEAEAAFEQAHELALANGSPSLALRAALSLVRHASTTKRPRAESVLRTIVDAFHGVSGARDLADARLLLRQTTHPGPG